jgi:WG repeat protein
MLMMKNKLVCLILLSLHCAAFAQEASKGTQLEPIYVNGRWGYADRSGKVVIPAQFDAARPFVEGLAQVGVVDEELPELEARPNIKWGYIDERGRVVVELRYAVLSGFSENLAAAAVLDAEKPERPALEPGNRLNLKWGYLDRSGRVVIPMQFLSAGDFAEGLANVNAVGGGGDGESSHCGAPGNYGYIDKTGAFVIKPQFKYASPFQNGRAHVSIGRTVYVGRCLCCAPRFRGTHGQVDRSGTFVADKPKDGGEALEEDRDN